MVVLVGWWGCAERQLARYAALWGKLGWSAVVMAPSPLYLLSGPALPGHYSELALRCVRSLCHRCIIACALGPFLPALHVVALPVLGVPSLAMLFSFRLLSQLSRMGGPTTRVIFHVFSNNGGFMCVQQPSVAGGGGRPLGVGLR